METDGKLLRFHKGLRVLTAPEKSQFEKFAPAWSDFAHRRRRLNNFIGGLGTVSTVTAHVKSLSPVFRAKQ